MIATVQTIVPRRLLRRAEVMARVGLPKSTHYSRISAEAFPKPVTLGSSGRIRGRRLDFGTGFAAGPRGRIGGYRSGYGHSGAHSSPCGIRLFQTNPVPPMKGIMGPTEAEKVL